VTRPTLEADDLTQPIPELQEHLPRMGHKLPATAHLSPKGRPETADCIFNHSSTIREQSAPLQLLRCRMRNNWELTGLETALFFAGVMLIAGGAVWATGLG
jgi:hypothetical protein